MAKRVESGIELSHREVTVVRGIGEKAVNRTAAGELEFQPIRGLDRLRVAFVPISVIQGEVHAACQQAGVETQSFRPYMYCGDSASPFSALVVRVVGDEAFPSISEGDPIPGRPGFTAVDVYPPQE